MQPSNLASPPARGTIVSGDPRQTHAIGRALGEGAAAGTFLALIGALGAGKTCMTKGVAEGLGVEGVVNSPTFVLMNEHVGRMRLFHVDAYRLGDPEEALASGLLDERQAEGVTVIEWADRLAGWLPSDRLDLELVFDPAGEQRRVLRWTAHGQQHETLALRSLARRASSRPHTAAR